MQEGQCWLTHDAAHPASACGKPWSCIAQNMFEKCVLQAAGCRGIPSSRTAAAVWAAALSIATGRASLCKAPDARASTFARSSSQGSTANLSSPRGEDLPPCLPRGVFITA